MDLQDHVSRDPGVMHGTACFRGTRIPVATLFDNLADGMTVDEILTQWPTLERAGVLAVLSYNQKNRHPRA